MAQVAFTHENAAVGGSRRTHLARRSLRSEQLALMLYINSGNNCFFLVLQSNAHNYYLIYMQITKPKTNSLN